MSVMEIIRARHSVREYLAAPIETEKLEKLQCLIDEIKRDSGLNIQLITNNPEAYQIIASFGQLKGVNSHIAFVVRDNSQDEAIGYWGQRIVLTAQEMGLNTCWTGIMSRKKSKAVRAADEKIRLAIAIGYGKTQGRPRKTKSFAELTEIKCAEVPAWFEPAVEAAQLAPTAMNNQHFKITLQEDGQTVSIEAPTGAYDTIDLGIVKCNFKLVADELGADWRWA